MGAIGGDSAVLADHIELLIGARPDENHNRRRIEEVAARLWGTDSVEISYAISVMRERQSILGEKYPFSVHRAYVVRTEPSPIYEALLGLTRTNWYYGSAELSRIDSTKAFELLTEHCLSEFYGPRTKSVNFGWPSTVGRPAEFSPAISWLADQIGIPVGTAYRQPRRKDGGVDIVLWRPFEDRRPGVPLMLVQATVQVDVLPKARDVDRRLWAGWLATDMEPEAVLAIPGTIASAEVWNEISRNTLLMDRMRLVSTGPPLDGETQRLCESIWEATREVVLHETQVE